MLNWFKNIFKKSNDSNRIPLIGSYLGDKSIKENEYNKFFIGWQYAAVTAIADSISGLDYRLADKYDKDVYHEYFDFITPELLQNIAIFIKMTGTAYVWKIKNGGKIIGLSILLPQNLTAKVDNNGNFEKRIYSENGKVLFLGKDEVLVFAEFNPYQRYPYITRGYSPIQAVAMTVRGEKEIETWNYSLLTNDVPPGMILTTDQALTEEQVKSIKSNWELNHTGAKNVGKMAILPFGIKPNNIQSSPKEMEFVAQQNRDRDKILAIYKVPKAVLGIGEGVNVGNVKSFNQIYATRCIAPLAKKISRVLNDGLFNGIGTFEFLNVLPTDEEAVREHYLSGGITRNEYRMELGYNPVKGGDVFFDGTAAETKVKNNGVSRNWEFDFKSIVDSYVPWSEEWMIKRRNGKQERYGKYESKLRIGFLKIFDKQKKDLISKIESKGYSTKELKLKLDKKYYALYHVYLKDTINEIITFEGKRAMEELKINKQFNVTEERIRNRTKSMLQLVAKEIDSVTDEKLAKAIGVSSEIGLNKIEIKEVLESVFKELETSRLDKIIRTESIRYGTFAEQEAWTQSGVVKYKQRWTAIDERRCSNCAELHGKKIPLSESFFDKGSKFNDLKLDYEDVIGSPLHPNCRCDMIPIIS